MQFKIALSLMILVLMHKSTAQEPQDQDIEKPDSTLNDVPVTSSCVTARKHDGVCVERQMCDYGSTAIDRSLYAPRGYKRPCKMQEVCCPVQSILQQTQPTVESNDKEFVFDADD